MLQCTQPPAQLLPVKPCANAGLGTAALEGLADPAGQGLSSSSPLSLACRSAQLTGFSSWMSTHIGATQASTLLAVHCKGKQGRRWHEAGKARMTCLGPSMAVSQPAECASGCSRSHPAVWAGGDTWQSLRGSCRAGDQESPVEEAACPTLNSVMAQHGQGTQYT